MKGFVAAACVLMALVSAKTLAPSSDSSTTSGTNTPTTGDGTVATNDPVDDFNKKIDELINGISATKTIAIGNYVIKVQQGCQLIPIDPPVPPVGEIRECYEAQQDVKFLVENFLGLDNDQLVTPSNFTSQFQACVLDFVPSVTDFIYKLCFQEDIFVYYSQYYTSTITQLQENGYNIDSNGVVTKNTSSSTTTTTTTITGGSTTNPAGSPTI